jgi:hypothetical protein
MIGVTKLIKKIFVPHFKFKNLRKMPRNIGGYTKRKARQQGKRVDKELSEFLAHGTNPRFCAETKHVIEKLAEKNLRLVNTQVYISNSDLNMCVYIDLIAVDQSGTFVIIEIKRGFQYRLCSTKNGFLKFHSPGVTDCFQNQHQLQSLLGKILFEHKHHLQCTCCLIYVNEACCDYIPESDFKAQINNDALETIKNMKTCKKRKR